MDEIIEQNDRTKHPLRFTLFDCDGLPWSSRLSWGWLLMWVSIIWFVFAPIVGLYLGLWLRSKGRSALVFNAYLAITGLCLVLFLVPFPARGIYSAVETVLAGLMVFLWLASAFLLRHEVAKYYTTREGLPFPLNPALTVLFGPWYVGGHLRADFPLDESGTTGAGVLKLIV